MRIDKERIAEYVRWWNACPLWQQAWESFKMKIKPEDDPTSPKWHGNKTTRARKAEATKWKRVRDLNAEAERQEEAQARGRR